MGQPDVEQRCLDNPLLIRGVLSLMTRRWSHSVRGLDAFPRDQWPDNIPLLYYSFHIMVGLGTIFIAIMTLAGILLWRRRLEQTRWMLWILIPDSAPD
jgi:cytochrome d ubiquinol oxidase subunit I